MVDCTFETKCWEEDWQVLLKTKYLKESINKCKTHFAKKRLFINNVNDPTLVKTAAQKAIDEKVFDEFFEVSEYSKQALKFFDISEESLKKGYYYSIAELVGIMLCDTKYLCHFAGDTRIEFSYSKSFVEEGIKFLEQNEDVAVVTPVWNYHYLCAEQECKEKRGNFQVGYGFSDQCYLIRTEEFKNQIYNYHHSASDRYPEYGGELFEKRVDSYMRTCNRKRAVYMPVSYLSDNIRGIQDYNESNSSVARMLRYFKHKFYWDRKLASDN